MQNCARWFSPQPTLLKSRDKLTPLDHRRAPANAFHGSSSGLCSSHIPSLHAAVSFLAFPSLLLPCLLGNIVSRAGSRIVWLEVVEVKTDGDDDDNDDDEDEDDAFNDFVDGDRKDAAVSGVGDVYLCMLAGEAQSVRGHDCIRLSLSLIESRWIQMLV